MPDYQDRAAWLAERKTGIGGSDAAAALGLSPWTTPLEVYLDKIGQLPDREENEDMYRGRLLEPVVRQMYADRTGREVARVPGIIRNPAIPFALADLDGVTEDRVVECKTARTRQGWGEPGSADIPLVYLIQVCHYMAVANFKQADVGVLFSGWEFEVFHVRRDAEFERMLLEQEAVFWECVQKRIPPEPRTAEDLKLAYPVALPVKVPADANILKAAANLRAVKEWIATLEDSKAALEASIKGAIKDAEALEFEGETIATWKNVNAAARFDAKRFASDHPKLYKRYLNEPTPTRQFLLKGKAKCLSTITTPMLEIPASLSLPAPEPQPA